MVSEKLELLFVSFVLFIKEFYSGLRKKLKFGSA